MTDRDPLDRETLARWYGPITIPRGPITDKQLAYLLNLARHRRMNEARLDAILAKRWPPGVTVRDLDSFTAGLVIDLLKTGEL